MKISEEALKEFKEIYKKCYHQDIPDEKACCLATNLLNLYKVVYSAPEDADREEKVERRRWNQKFKS